MAADEDEYHAYLIISLEARTMVYFASVCWLFFIRSFYYPQKYLQCLPFQVLETADLLTEVTESVDYYVQGRTIAAGNLFGR